MASKPRERALKQAPLAQSPMNWRPRTAEDLIGQAKRVALAQASNPDRVEADYAVLAGLSKGLSGGDILNICLNAIYAGSTDANPERWVVTQGMIEAEIKKARKAKAEHSGEEPQD